MPPMNIFGRFPPLWCTLHGIVQNHQSFPNIYCSLFNTFHNLFRGSWQCNEDFLNHSWSTMECSFLHYWTFEQRGYINVVKNKQASSIMYLQVGTNELWVNLVSWFQHFAYKGWRLIFPKILMAHHLNQSWLVIHIPYHRYVIGQAKGTLTLNNYLTILKESINKVVSHISYFPI